MMRKKRYRTDAIIAKLRQAAPGRQKWPGEIGQPDR